MSNTLAPRAVDKPFRMRWLRMTLQLLVRCPLRFSAAILLLGCLDASTARLLSGHTVPRDWMVGLGMLVLPLAWAFIAAVARGADDASQRWKGLAGLMHFRVWMNALAVGGGLIALNRAVWLLLGAHVQHEYQVIPGRVLEFSGAQACMINAAIGICFFPLLVLQPTLSLTEVKRLARSASEINGRRAISGLMVGMLGIAAVLQLFVPAYGMTSAAWLVFMGVLNYVAYRDIFERRPGNAPDTVASTVPLSATAPGEAV